MTSFTSSRARRIFGGWSANVVGLVLALTQQIVLIPLFLKYWTGETLAAWLAIFAAGMLALTLDAGLHVWSLNRFLQFKARADCDRRTNRFYGAMLRLYAGYSAVLILTVLTAFSVFAPSRLLGFSYEPAFDLSFAIMAPLFPVVKSVSGAFRSVSMKLATRPQKDTSCMAFTGIPLGGRWGLLT